MGQICHLAGGCNCNWRLSAPRGDKRLSEPGGVRAEPIPVQGLPARLQYPRRTVQQAGVFTRGSSLSLLLQPGSVLRRRDEAGSLRPDVPGLLSFPRRGDCAARRGVGVPKEVSSRQHPLQP